MVMGHAWQNVKLCHRIYEYCTDIYHHIGKKNRPRIILKTSNKKQGHNMLLVLESDHG